MSGRRRQCAHFMHAKQRLCNVSAVEGQQFCGNHLQTEGQPEDCQRLPCPWDPNHTVKKGQLERHKDVCPKFVEIQSLGKKAWHVPSCNAGEGPDVELLCGVQHSTSTALDGEGLAQRRATYAQQMGPQALNSLMQKVHTAYEQECCQEPPVEVLEPPTANWLTREGPRQNRPFSMKHAQQQASIIGHMAKAGLLQAFLSIPSPGVMLCTVTGAGSSFAGHIGGNPGGLCDIMLDLTAPRVPVWLVQDAGSKVYVELGAGKGYLSCALADCAQVGQVVLVDVGTFRLKGDRSLRQRPGLQMQRVRCDLRDFDPAGLCWQAPQAGVAAQPAASMAMLHCPDCRARWDAGHGVCLAHRPPAGQRQGQNGQQLAAEGHAVSRASENESAEQQRAATAARESSKGLWGLPHGLGPGAPWVAHGKHLCGAATDFALRCCSGAVVPGSSARPLSHARSPSLTGQAHAATLASATAAQETPNIHRPKVLPDGSSASPAAQGTELLPLLDPGRLQGLAIAVCCHHRCTWRQYVGKPMFERLGFSPEEFEVVSWMTGWALCGHEAAAGAAQAEEGGRCREPDSEYAGVTKGGADPQHPAAAWGREERIVIGQQCKHLIDEGRRQWLQQMNFVNCQIAQYVDPLVSGENCILLALPPKHPK